MIRVIKSNGAIKFAGTGSGVTGDLQAVTDNGNATTTDIVITDSNSGFVLKAPDGTTKRIVLRDDGFGNFQLELQNYP